MRTTNAPDPISIPELLTDILIELKRSNSITEQTNRASQALWTAVDIGHYLHLKPATVHNNITSNTSFPLPYRLSNTKKGGGKRWKSSEVKAWAVRHRDVPKRDSS